MKDTDKEFFGAFIAACFTSSIFYVACSNSVITRLDYYITVIGVCIWFVLPLYVLLKNNKRSSVV